MLTLFVKMRNLQLMSIENRRSVGFISSSKVSYLKHKICLIESLLIRCFSLCSDFIKFYHEIDKFKIILYKNSNPHVDKILAPKNSKYSV